MTTAAGAPAPAAAGSETDVVVKLRPGTHFVPTARGLYCWRAGRSFLLGGPPSLYRLVDRHLDALTDGTTVTELAARSGDPAARPVLDRVVRVLLREDILFEVSPYDAAPPDAATSQRYADVLTRLEERCAQPYAAFAALRAARVRVAGSGPAVPAVLRGLAAHGVPTCDGPDPDLVVLVSHEDSPQAIVPGVPLLPVLTRPDLILVGPVLPGPAALPRLLAAAGRAAAWQRGDPSAAPPPVIGAVLAGSLAAVRVLDRLAGISGGDRDAVVVYGRTAQTGTIPLPWAAAGTEPGADGSAVDGERAAGPDGTLPDDDEVLQRAAPLTAPWRGLGRWTDPPAAGVRTARAPTGGALAAAAPAGGASTDPAPPDGGATAGAPAGGGADNGSRAYGSLWVAGLRPLAGPVRYRWGDSAPASRRAAAVDLLREWVRTAGAPPVPGAVPAAGATVGHWYLDGALRLIGRSALRRAANRALRWDDLTASPVRAMYSGLADYLDRPVRLAEHRVPGLSWSLVQVTDAAAGTPLATEWGPSTVAAARAALSAVLAGILSGTTVADDPVGTTVVERLGAATLAGALRQVRAGRPMSAQRLATDPGLGTPPLPCGWLWYADRDAD